MNEAVPLNAAQIQRVNAELQKVVNDQALRKWCIEIAVQVIQVIEPTAAGKVGMVELADQIYGFLNPKHEQLQ